MVPVAVRILHPEPPARAGALERVLARERGAFAERHAAGFRRAGATDVRIVSGPPDDTPFGARLRSIEEREHPAGLVVLGSGAVPLASAADLRAFVGAAAATTPGALTNDYFSADIVAIAEPRILANLPDLATDNGLPRWLAEVGGVPVRDLKRRWRLAVDLDSPLDLVLVDGGAERLDAAVAGDNPSDIVRPALDRLGAIRGLFGDPAAEVLIAGRTSASTLAWLERRTRSRTRALVEERGLRTAPPGQRASASVLGILLERDGPAALGDHLARLADAALVDTRVLLAHRLGRDERAWPSAENRYASDLLLPERIADPWLRELTASAVAAAIPILLGGHSLVGPGARLVAMPSPSAE